MNKVRTWRTQCTQCGLTTVLPDVSYNPSEPCPVDLDGSGAVGVGDILALIDICVDLNSHTDLDGSVAIEVVTLLL